MPKTMTLMSWPMVTVWPTRRVRTSMAASLKNDGCGRHPWKPAELGSRQETGLPAAQGEYDKRLVSDKLLVVLNTQGPCHTVRPGDWGVTVRNTTNVLLDQIREAKGLNSDYALAKVLNVNHGAIGHYRGGRSHMRDDLVLLAAKMLGLAPAPLLNQIAGERTKDAELARIWKDAAKQLGRKGR